MLPIELHQSKRQLRNLPAFSLVELVLVILIVSVLLAVSTQVFSSNTGNARIATIDIINAHLQQARAHAISSGMDTALVIPVLATGSESGARALSIFEVEKTGPTYEPARDANGEERQIRQWEILPGNFHFFPASIITAATPTVVDSSDTLATNFRGNVIDCHFIVFAPTGQIVLPGSAINLAIGRAVSGDGGLTPLERNAGNPVYDLLQVNRLTGRTRPINP